MISIRTDGFCLRGACALGVAFFAVVQGAEAQFSGYASGSYGFHSDPLYNYATVPDHVTEGYWEMGYFRPSKAHDVRFGYVGGLMIFDALAERNYYEHRLDVAYAARYGTFRKVKGENDDSEEDGENGEIFHGNRIDLRGTLSARYDNSAYNQYDNTGLDLTGGFTWGVGSGTEFTISDRGGLRRYAYLPELNNITDLLTLRIAGGENDSLRLGAFLSAGIKHFTTGKIDTTRVSIGGGTFTQGNKGKGKGGAGLGSGNGGGQGGRTVQILENSGTTETYQMSAGASAAWRWEGGNIESQILYRYNPGSGIRFLVQYANSTLLSEDIYNDYFSYGGPEATLTFRQTLPFALQFTVQSEASWKKYLAPALNLEAVESSPHRIDLRGVAELTLSRSFQIDDAWSFDVTAVAGAIRNRSNDMYNDYSLFFYSVGVGIGL